MKGSLKERYRAFREWQQKTLHQRLEIQPSEVQQDTKMTTMTQKEDASKKFQDDFSENVETYANKIIELEESYPVSDFLRRNYRLSGHHQYGVTGLYFFLK